MKKIICLILSAAVLISSAFAIVDFSQPSDEVIENIKNALEKDCYEILHSKHWTFDPSDPYKPAKVDSVDVIANIDSNYVISFVFYDVCMCGGGPIFSVGDYMINPYLCAYGVYSSADNKVMPIPEAYDKGIITNEDMYEIWKNQKDKSKEFSFIINKSDINQDSEIDILDVACYRAYIVKNSGEDWSDTLYDLGDLNGDNERDIIDLAMLRNIIING